MTDQQILDVEEIRRRLPHVYPFLLVDRVTRIEPDRSIVALKNVTINEAHFSGHFPGYAVMPGVLIIEALAQAGGVLAWESRKVQEEGVKILYLVGVDGARFKRPVVPGDQLVLKVELTAQRRGLWRFDCVAEVDGQVAAECTVSMVTRKEA